MFSLIQVYELYLLLLFNHLCRFNRSEDITCIILKKIVVGAYYNPLKTLFVPFHLSYMVASPSAESRSLEYVVLINLPLFKIYAFSSIAMNPTCDLACEVLPQNTGQPSQLASWSFRPLSSRMPWNR